MELQDKIDKLLEDVSTVKLLTSQHTESLQDLEAKLQPIFDHVTTVRTILKVSSGIVGILACVATILLLFK
jgi:hypothetical protein